MYCSLGTDHSNSSMHSRAKYSTLISTVPLVLTIQIQACLYAPKILCQCLLFPWYWWRWCLLFLWYHTGHSSMHLSWCTTVLWQPKSHRINITIKINCISATTLNTDMLSKSHTKSRPIKKVGFFCYRCGRDDFKLNQKSLSAHVRHCSFIRSSPKFSPLFW